MTVIAIVACILVKNSIKEFYKDKEAKRRTVMIEDFFYANYQHPVKKNCVYVKQLCSRRAPRIILAETAVLK